MVKSLPWFNINYGGNQGSISVRWGKMIPCLAEINPGMAELLVMTLKFDTNKKL